LVEVQKPLQVSITASGKGFDQCAPIHLEIDGHVLQPIEQTADTIRYGSVKLSAGELPVSLFVPSDASAGGGKGEVISVKFNNEK
jgi:hypothetical protein